MKRSGLRTSIKAGLRRALDEVALRPWVVVREKQKYLGSGPSRSPSSSPLPLPSRTWCWNYLPCLSLASHCRFAGPVKFTALFDLEWRFTFTRSFSTPSSMKSSVHFDRWVKSSPGLQGCCVGSQRNQGSIEVSFGPENTILLIFGMHSREKFPLGLETDVLNIHVLRTQCLTNKMLKNYVLKTQYFEWIIGDHLISSGNQKKNSE